MVKNPQRKLIWQLRSSTASATADDPAIADLGAQLKMKRDVRW